MERKNSVTIIGAGPAGLSAGYELLKAGYSVTILESSSLVGGISRTEVHNGNHIDIGGHRFFSKSETVMQWWDSIMSMDDFVRDNNALKENTLLLRNRLSRILYLRKLFSYPITLSKETVINLGLVRMSLIGISYIKSRLFPIKDEVSLEDFFINRFGTELYNTFFRDYTEKVWGVPCSEIGADWGRQRIKGLSIAKAIKNALFSSKEIETSLIEQFWYPMFGPGYFWERVATLFQENGGTLLMEHQVSSINILGKTVMGITALDSEGKAHTFDCDHLISSAPISSLCSMIEGFNPKIKALSSELLYRDFITIGILINKTSKDFALKDNWIYIQEPDVKVGRMQIFNNWSPAMVNDPNTVWVGLEYFTNEGDALWSMNDADIVKLAKKEFSLLGFAHEDDIIDAVCIRVPKAYPSYFGEAYESFEFIKGALSQYVNLYCVGRNGQHRYNNMDHSMLTSFYAVECILDNSKDKNHIWEINSEQSYHETSKGDAKHKNESKNH